MEKLKKVRFELKLTEEERNKLKSSAALKGMTVNRYVMDLVNKDIKEGETKWNILAQNAMIKES